MKTVLRLLGIPLAGATLLLGACSTTEFQVGQDFDPSTFTSRVQRGVTTKDDVRAWLGEASATGIDVETDGDRFDEWTYYFGHGSLTKLSGAKLKTLQIKFDGHGIVQGFNFSQPVP